MELSGQLNALAVALMKIANDLRWMNSGPLAGLGEIELPALQPGSSIMPGKVNPVIPEALCMVCAQVIGHHAAITVAGASRQLPAQRDVAADRLRPAGFDRTAVQRHAPAGRQGDRRAARCDTARVREALDRNPILVTALNPVIGYEKAAADRQACLRGKPAGSGRRDRGQRPAGKNAASPARSCRIDAKAGSRSARVGEAEPASPLATQSLDVSGLRGRSYRLPGGLPAVLQVLLADVAIRP